MSNWHLTRQMVNKNEKVELFIILIISEGCGCKDTLFVFSCIYCAYMYITWIDKGMGKETEGGHK